MGARTSKGYWCVNRRINKPPNECPTNTYGPGMLSILNKARRFRARQWASPFRCAPRHPTGWRGRVSRCGDDLDRPHRATRTQQERLL
jgi:hypothetical protein